MPKTAVIIGAGPAGLTAAYELLDRTDIVPVVYEMSADIGGISKTVNYKGNRMDIGGHRFFSKSDWVMGWWRKFMPLEGSPGPDPEKTDKVMLVRSRLSRIFFLGRFFDYPITLNKGTFNNLGLVRVAKIGMSYVKARMFPIRHERSLEDFFINRFGRELYLTFFKDYTEKVWGVPCSAIKPEWGAQRIKGLSVTRAITHALKKAFSNDNSIEQKGMETSLIEQFLYPKFGPGQLWEEVADRIRAMGGEIRMRHAVTGMRTAGTKVSAVTVVDRETGQASTRQADYFFSTMPVRDLVAAMGESVPEKVREVAAGLVYRDFITVGLLLRKLKMEGDVKTGASGGIVPDNWIYIQEREVKLGRLQIFNNWSPYMVADRGYVWMGLEYFCNEGDALWKKSDPEFMALAAEELESIGFIDKADVVDGVVIRMPKTYPAYFGTYDDFGVVREFTDSFENLFLLGRNGMHRYNNQDHSMLAAKTAVDNIIAGVTTKDNVWAVNAEQEYHEEKGGHG
jgi:protoporphyrinogen oxidase